MNTILKLFGEIECTRDRLVDYGSRSWWHSRIALLGICCLWFFSRAVYLAYRFGKLPQGRIATKAVASVLAAIMIANTGSMGYIYAYANDAAPPSSIVDVVSEPQASVPKAEALPTEEPTTPPTEEPTTPPTEVPATPPTEVPATPPTEVPATPPTEEPTTPPTEVPSTSPTEEPSTPPIEEPTTPSTEPPCACPTVDSGEMAHTEDCSLYESAKPAVPEQSEAVKAVLVLIGALPTMDELAAQDTEGEGFADYLAKLRLDTDTARAAFDALTDEEKATLDPAVLAKLTELEGVLAVMPVVMSLDAITITINNNTTTQGGTSLQAAVDTAKGVDGAYTDITELTITAGKVTAADWTWFAGGTPGNTTPVLSNLTHFTITDNGAVTAVAAIPNGYVNKPIFPTTIVAVTIPQTIAIGTHAFFECIKLTTATIPNATIIGDQAFYGCRVLDNISFLNVTSIGEYAFSECKKLTTAIFPAATTAGKKAFEGCIALTSADFLIMQSVAIDMFIGCSKLATVSFPAATSIKGNAFNNCGNLATVSFPVVTSIGLGAFFNTSTTEKLTTASFPKATSIEAYAFSGCSKLAELRLGATVPTVGTDAFKNCLKTTLTLVDASDNELTDTALTDAQAAYDKVVSPDTGTATDDLWYGWRVRPIIAVTGVTLDKATLALEVDKTEALTATVAPTNAANQTVTWSSSNTSVATVDTNGVVTAVAAGSATITVTTTDGSITATCVVTITAPITIKINESTTTYGGADLKAAVDKAKGVNAYADITKLTITAGEVTAADWTWFATGKLGTNTPVLEKLTHFTVDASIADGKVADIHDGAQFAQIFPKTITTVTIPKLITIGNSAFSGCTTLATASFPDAINIGNSAFYSCRGLTTASFPKATSIGESAFSVCTTLATASFPDAINIGKNAFNGCTALKTASFPKATSIGENAFYECLILKTASFPTATSIGGNAFYYCTKLDTLKLGAAVPAVVNANAFTLCPTPRTLTLVDESDNALTGTTLTDAQAAYDAVLDGMSSSTTTDDLWYGWRVRPIIAVTGVTLDKATLALEVDKTETLTATVAPTNAANQTVTWNSSKASVATVDAAGLVTAVAAGSATITVTTADGGKTATCAVTVSVPIITITVTDGSTTKTNIGGASLSGAIVNSTLTAANITELTITAGEVTATDWRWLKNLSKLTHLTIDAGIANGKVAGIPNIDGGNRIIPTTIVAVNIPQAITIGLSAFRGCIALESASFPAATGIGNNAFEGCKLLTSVDFSATITIGENAFYNCPKLPSVNFPAATTIGRTAFRECIILTTASFPVATSIGELAFNGCTQLATLKLGATVPTTVGANAFASCPKTTLKLVDASGNALTESTTPTLSTVAANYDKVVSPDTGTATDGLWFGWKVREPVAAVCTCTLSAPIFENSNVTIPSDQATAPHALTATGSTLGGSCAVEGHSSTAVTYGYAEKTDTSNIASITGATLTVTGAGSVVVTATAAANGKTATADATFTVTKEVAAPKITIKINDVATEHGGATLQAAVTASGVTVANIKKLTITKGVVTTDDWKYLKSLTALTDFTIDASIVDDKVANIPSISSGNTFPTSIVNVTIPQSIEIGNFAFYKCLKLETVNIPKATSIGGAAFNECTEITTVSFPMATNIGQSAFSGCTKLNNLKLGATVPIVADYAFARCPTTRNLALVNASGAPLTGATLTTAQENYDRVVDYITGSTATDGKWYGWKVREPVVDAPKITITVTDGTTTTADIGGASLQAAVAASGVAVDKIKTLTITAGEVTAADWTWLMNGGYPVLSVLTEFAIVANIADGKVADLPDNTGTFGTFRSDSIKKVTIPQKIKIGKSTFKFCKVLTDVNIPKAESIGLGAFIGCEKLVSLNLPVVTSIGEEAFKGCTALTTLRLPSSPPTADKNIFYQLTNKPAITLVDANGNALTESTTPKLSVVAAAYDKVVSPDTGTDTDGLWHGAKVREPIEAEWTPTGGVTASGTLVDGFAALKNTGGTIKLVADITKTDTFDGTLILIDTSYLQPITFDLAGKKLAFTGGNKSTALFAALGNTALFTITDSSAGKTGGISMVNGFVVCADDTAKLALSGGTYTASGNLDGNIPILGAIALYAVSDAYDEQAAILNSFCAQGFVFDPATLSLDTEMGIMYTAATVKVAPNAPIAVTGVVLDKTTLALEARKSKTLTATIVPATATNQAVTWSSSNPAVVTVDADGNVTAAAVGNATITVTTTDGSKTATCAVTVTAATSKPAPGGKLEAPLTQDKVDDVFGEGNATLDDTTTPPTIKLEKDITPEKPIEVETDVTIDLGGNTITGKTGETPIIVGDNDKVTIDGSGTIAGGDSTTGTGGNGITGGTGSDITIGNDVIVSGGDGTTGSDGINSGGNVTVDGGTVTGGNGSSGNGGDGIDTSTGSGNITIDNGGSASGGNGGNGSAETGGNGGNGTNSGSGSTTVDGETTGGSGGNGTTGGGLGGDGSTSTGGGSITVDGETSGGTGGNASSGTGGNGGDGSETSGNTDINSGGSSTGGAGGNGSVTGGNGGSGTGGGNVNVDGGGTTTGGAGGTGSTTGGSGGNGTNGDNTTINGGTTGGAGGNGNGNGSGGDGGNGANQGSGTVGGNGDAIGGDGGNGAGTGNGGSGGAGVGGGAGAGSVTTKPGANGRKATAEVDDSKSGTTVTVPDESKLADAALTEAEKNDPAITEVKVVLNVEKKNNQPDKAEVDAVLKQPSVAADTIGAFFDITLGKIITNAGGIQPPVGVANASEEIEITITIPSDMRGGSNYVVIRVHNGTGAALATTKSGNDLTFSTDRFSTYAIAYTKNTTPPPTSSGGSSSDNDEYDFWMTVGDKIQKADRVDVIKVSAKHYDKMPASVMRALYKSGVGVVITWDGGKTITIPTGKAAKQETGRIYYPLSLLAQMYKGIAYVETPTGISWLNPETGGGYIAYADGKQIPITGGVTELAPPATDSAPDTAMPGAPTTITSPTAGFEADAFAGTPDAKAARSTGTAAIAGFAMLLAALCGGGVWFWKRKTGKYS